MSVTAESLFREVFLPLYPEDARSDLGRARSTDANPAKNPALYAHLGEAAAVFAANAPIVLGVPESELGLDFSDASVHRLSAALTIARRDRLLEKGEKGTADNALFNLLVHGASYVGACIVRSHGGVWMVRRPLWESLVQLSSRLGEGELPVFHWLLKSLADDAPSTLADRYRAHVEVPCAKPEELPVLAPEDRNLPRLKRPRYDSLYKYIKAHLPELRDVGDDFPSPERFEELRFEHLSFLLVGGGRMLVMHGHNEHGLHAMWLGKSGFEKSAFWPCDKFPEPILRRAGDDKLEVLLSQNGAVRSFELLWWGP
ncbi:MAG TPA: hypothetical protein VLT33_04450 [Labilithrix sp.]|nr:hypothetical protein [Labilithrix sp.]